MRRFLMIADIDADTEYEAERLLDEYREGVTRIGVKGGPERVTLYRATNKDMQEAGIDHEAFEGPPERFVNLPPISTTTDAS